MTKTKDKICLNNSKYQVSKTLINNHKKWKMSNNKANLNKGKNKNKSRFKMIRSQCNSKRSSSNKRNKRRTKNSIIQHMAGKIISSNPTIILKINQTKRTIKLAKVKMINKVTISRDRRVLENQFIH